MKIAILTGDPELQNRFAISNTRPWTKTISSEKHQGPVKFKKRIGKKVINYMTPNIPYIRLDDSILAYLKMKYPSYKVDLVYPNKITYSNLVKYDLIFYNMYDPVAASINSMNKGKELQSILYKLKNKVYPPTNVTDLIHDKCAYYDFLKNNNIPIVKTECLDIDKVNLTKINELLIKIKSWKKVFAKPVLGTSGRGGEMFSKPTQSDILEYVKDRKNEGFPKIVFQKYHPEFSTTRPEMRLYFIGDKYEYTIMSDDQDVFDAPSTEGGSFKVSKSNHEKAKLLAKKVINLLTKKLKYKTKLVTRIDIGCCQDFNAKGNKYFVNEIEYAPAFLVGMMRNSKQHLIDVKIAEQMIKIAKTKNK